jgi:hypothetical protein
MEITPHDVASRVKHNGTSMFAREPYGILVSVHHVCNIPTYKLAEDYFIASQHGFCAALANRLKLNLCNKS